MQKLRGGSSGASKIGNFEMVFSVLKANCNISESIKK